MAIFMSVFVYETEKWLSLAGVVWTCWGNSCNQLNQYTILEVPYSFLEKPMCWGQIRATTKSRIPLIGATFSSWGPKSHHPFFQSPNSWMGYDGIASRNATTNIPIVPREFAVSILDHPRTHRSSWFRLKMVSSNSPGVEELTAKCWSQVMGSTHGHMVAPCPMPGYIRFHVQFKF